MAAMDHRSKAGAIATPVRLRPEMASLRLIVLKFITDYIGQWGGSPSYGEIAHGCDTNRDRVKKIVHRLARDGLINHVRGPRGISLPQQEQAAAAHLRKIGYRIDTHQRIIKIGRRRFSDTEKPLLPPVELDYQLDQRNAGENHGPTA